MSSNSTNFSVDAISSLINQNQFLELETKKSLIKALRAATGQFKTIAQTSNNTTSLVTAGSGGPEGEFSYVLSGGRPYVINADLLFLVGGAVGPLGGLKVQLNLPAHGANNYTLEGIITTTAHATAPTIIGLGSNTNVGFAGAVQGANAALTLAAATTTNVLTQVSVQALLIPTVDDVLTFAFGQVSAAAANPTILLRGSAEQCLALAASRRAPNVV